MDSCKSPQHTSVSSTHFWQDIWNFLWKKASQEVPPCERFSASLLSIAVQKMKCGWPQARFLPSHAYSSRVRGCMSRPCNTVLVCFPLVAVHLFVSELFESPLLLRFASVPVSVRSSLAHTSSISHLLIPEPLQHLLQPWVNVLLLDVLTVQRQLLEITYSHLVQTPPRCPGHN